METCADNLLACSICGKTKDLKRCGFCKRAFYCSREHQIKDWTEHKPICQQIRNNNEQKTLQKRESLQDKVDISVNIDRQSMLDRETNANLQQPYSNDLDYQYQTNGENSNICTRVAYSVAQVNRNENKTILSQHAPPIETSSLTDTSFSRLQGPSSVTLVASGNSPEHGSEQALINKTDDQLNKTKHEGIPFDVRPYKLTSFLDRKSSIKPKEIAEVAVENLDKNGFCVIDGVFSETLIRRSLEDIEKCEKSGKFDIGRLSGGRTSDIKDKQVVNSGIRSDKIMWMEGSDDDIPGLRDVINRLDEILVQFNEFLGGRYFINGRTKAMVACYPGNGTYYRRHVDNPNKDGRVVTCILYLNNGWDAEKDGGILRILPADNDGYIDIAPVANRLLFFWSDWRNPHEVHPAFKTRYAVTIWYMDEEESEKAKRDQVDEEMSNIRGEHLFSEIKKRQKSKEEVQRKIEDAASLAIASLSLEELQAMASVIAGQPNPKEVLCGMGIAPDIQDKLLQRFKQLW